MTEIKLDPEQRDLVHLIAEATEESVETVVNVVTALGLMNVRRASGQPIPKPICTEEIIIELRGKEAAEP